VEQLRARLAERSDFFLLGWRASAWSTRRSTRSTTCATPRPIAAPAEVPSPDRGRQGAQGRGGCSDHLPVAGRPGPLRGRGETAHRDHRGGYVSSKRVYNLGAKHVPLLDVFLLSSGFVIRVLLGCSLVSAPPSAWLLLCTSTLALFLGFHQAPRRLDRRNSTSTTGRVSAATARRFLTRR